jgi:hypothetical protein
MLQSHEAHAVIFSARAIGTINLAECALPRASIIPRIHFHDQERSTTTPGTSEDLHIQDVPLEIGGSIQLVDLARRDV